MYFLTALSIDSNSFIHKASLGYFPKKSEAFAVIMNEPKLLHQDQYEYLVVEKIEQGIFTQSDEEDWFLYDEKNKVWNPTSKPTFLEPQCNFSIG